MLDITIILTLFFLSCSITTSVSIIVYFALKKDLKRQSSRFMISMALADFVGATFWFADIMYSICPTWMVLNLYGYQAAQTWSCAIGAYLLLKFSGKRMPPEIVFHLVAWGTPIISQVIILGGKMYREFPPPQGCWLEFGQAEMLVVAIPQAVTVLINTIFLGLMFFRSTRDGYQLRNRDRSLVYIEICCLFTTFASVLQSVPDAPPIIYQMSFLFGASQGWLNALSMRQSAFFRILTWTNQRLSAQVIQQSQRIIKVARDMKDRKKEDAKELEAGVAPSTALLIKPFGTYHAIPKSEIN